MVDRFSVTDQKTIMNPDESVGFMRNQLRRLESELKAAIERFRLKIIDWAYPNDPIKHGNSR